MLQQVDDDARTTCCSTCAHGTLMTLRPPCLGVPWPMELTPIHPRLFRASMPRTPADAGKLLKAGVERVISLDHGTPVGMLRTAGLHVHPLFTPDMEPPSFDVLDRARDLLAEDSRTVAVHCIAGWGRTGSVVAAHLGVDLAHADRGLDPEECAWQALRSFWTKVPAAEPHMRRFGQAANVVDYVRARAERS